MSVECFEDFHPLLASTIAGIATEYGRKGHWLGANGDDFTQEMVSWLLDNESTVAARFSGSTEQATSYVAKCLRNECKDYLARLRKQAIVDSGDTQYDYGRDELKLLVQLMFNPADAERLSVTVVESVADVARAYAALSDEDQSILSGFHRDGWNNKMMAEAYRITEAAMSARHNRVVLRLQRLLGGPGFTEYNYAATWTGRRAVSNSVARANLANAYED
jgi:RNA polymerase sigma factor (sigma-70 family)